MSYLLNRRGGARALATSAAALAVAAAAPGAAEAAGWDVKIDVGAGGAVEVEGYRCETTCTRHFVTRPDQHLFGRQVSIEADPAFHMDDRASWTGCDSVEGKTCKLVLPLVIPNPFDESSYV